MRPEEIDAVVSEIQMFYNKPYSVPQREAWRTMFNAENAGIFRQAWKRFQESATTEHRPTHGALKKLCDDIRAEQNETFAATNGENEKPRFVISKDEQEENEAAAIFLQEVILWHALGLVQKQETAMDAPTFDMDKWRHAGKPALWSPILTHAYGALAEIWHQAHEDKTKFYRDYTAHLRGSRARREATAALRQDSIGDVMAGGNQ
jgi:hypothetical protein